MSRRDHFKKKRSSFPSHSLRSKSPRKAAAIVFIIFFSLFGMGIGYFASGSVIALLPGLLIGGVVGYFIGHGLDKMARKK